MPSPRLTCLLLAFALLPGCDVVRGIAAAQAVLACLDRDADAPSIVTACTAVIERDGSEPRDVTMAHIYRANAKETLGDLPGALADFDRAQAREPKFGTPYEERGAFHRRHGELEQARRDLEKAIEIDGMQQFAMVNLASVYEERHEWDAAMALYTRAHAALPKDLIPLNGLCWVRAVRNIELDLALADCDRALALGPNEPNTHDSRGFVHFRAGRLEQSIADYDRAIALDPRFMSSYYVRGLAKRALGRTTEGDADVAHALQGDPGIAARYAGYGVEVGQASDGNAAASH